MTRATEVLRLPVPRYCAIWLTESSSSGFGFCGLVRMLGAGVDLELRDLLPREPVLGEHPLDRDAEHLGRPAVELLAERPAAQAAGIARVAVVPLLVELVAR